MSAGRRHARAVAEELVKGGVVLLHAGSGRCIAVSHCAVDHVKACLSLYNLSSKPAKPEPLPGKDRDRHSMLKMRLGAVPDVEV